MDPAPDPSQPAPSGAPRDEVSGSDAAVVAVQALVLAAAIAALALILSASPWGDARPGAAPPALTLPTALPSAKTLQRGAGPGELTATVGADARYFITSGCGGWTRS